MQAMVSTKEFLKIVENANRWKHDINYSVNPLKYEVTDDCGGMYTCEPYKTKLLKLWRFSTPAASKESSKSIKGMFFDYLNEGDFVGADLALKYLRAGSIRDAIPKKSKKYFKLAYKEIKDNIKYFSLRKEFEKRKNQEQERYGER